VRRAGLIEEAIVVVGVARTAHAPGIRHEPARAIRRNVLMVAVATEHQLGTGASKPDA